MSEPVPQSEMPASWEPLILALTTNEEKDRARRFIHSCQVGPSDRLSGLILILKANTQFLLGLPQKLHEEFTSPLHMELNSFRVYLTQHRDQQLTANSELEKASKFNETTVQLVNSIMLRVETVLKDAVENLDTTRIAEKTTQSLEASTLLPFRKTVEKLLANTSQIELATSAATRSIEIWRRVNLLGIVAVTALVALFFSGAVIGFGWWKMQTHYNRMLITRTTEEINKVNQNKEVLKLLSSLNVPIRIDPAVDVNEKPIRDVHALVIEGAENASFTKIKGRNNGIIFFKAQTK